MYGEHGMRVGVQQDIEIQAGIFIENNEAWYFIEYEAAKKKTTLGVNCYRAVRYWYLVLGNQL